MKVQGYWVLSLFIAAALTFAGCGDTASDSGNGGTTPAAASDGGDDAGGDTEEGSDAKEGSDNASTEAPSGEFQMVSLNVPNMT